MNSVFRLVWNTSNTCWQAVAETARGRHKNKTKTGVCSSELIPIRIQRFNLKPLALCLSIGLFGATVYAEPTGGQITAGAGTINQTGAITTINQATQNMAIDWHSFNIRANEAVNFNQPNANAIALNRVTGTESSSIMGSLSANGKVFILNPNGVLFGAGAQVNVGGLVTSTLNLSNENFMAGNFNFTGNGIGSVVNNGNINIAEGGTLAFIAPVVKNNGTIVANNGRVLMAAADDVTLTLQDGNMVSYTLNKGSVQSMIDSGGLIQANGGHVIITTKGLDALSKSAINHTGIIEAQTVNNNNGVIELLGDMEIGTLNVAGTLDASAPTNGDGGFIETSAAKVNIANDVNVTTIAENGETGTWLIDPVDFTVAATGGDITGSALASNLNNNNVTIQSFAGANGSNGDININEYVEWNAATTLTLNAYNNINFNKSISAINSNGKLALEYGQGAAAEGNTSTYNINAAIGLQAGFNFSTKQGSDGVTNVYKVIKFLGSETATSGFTLQSIRSDPSANYALGSSISVGTSSGGGATTWNDGKGFDPIDNFSGKFDGLGHNINFLVINRPAEDFVGLFANTNGATIRNVELVNPSVIGGNYVGGLAGDIRNTFVDNSGIINITNPAFSGVFADAGIAGEGYVGGLIGEAFNSKVINSYSSTKVTGSSAGGLIGNSISSTVDNSNATGSVTGDIVIGGLVGSAYDKSYISNSYASGNISKDGETDTFGGLVGYLRESTVKNSYSDGNVSGYSTIGGLVGQSEGSYILNSYATGDVSGKYSVGGLVGYSIRSGKSAPSEYINIIENSYATGNVIGEESNTGGLVGYAGFGSVISNTYATGNVIGKEAVGGLVGKVNELGNLGNYSYLSINSVTDSYATGNVSGNNYVGGLLGLVNPTSISNTYSTGNITGSSFVGGLVGYQTTTTVPFVDATSEIYVSTISASYWNTQTSVQSISSGGEGKTTAEMQQQATYTGWDFNNVWRIQEGSSYPLLRALTEGTIIIDPTKPNLGITGPNVSKIYDGIAVNSVTDLSSLSGWNGGATASGLLGADTLLDSNIFSGTLRYDGTWQGALNAGDYSIIPAGLSSQKYAINYINGSLKINPKEIEVGTLAIGADNKTKTYGEVDPVFTYTLNQGQLIGSDAITGSLAREAGEDVRVGGYSITQGSLTAGSNYTINFTNGVLTIEPRPLILQAQDTSRYVGDANPDSTSVLSIGPYGLAFNDRIDGFTFSSSAPSNALADTKHSISISSVSFANGAKASNYDISLQSGELTIVPDTHKFYGYWDTFGLTNAEYNRFLDYDILITDQVKKEFSLADASYGSSAPDQFDIIKVSPPSPSDFNAVAYQDKLDGKVYIAFRGSELSSVSDWTNNYVQWRNGLSPQYEEALAFAKEVQLLRPQSEIKLTGHSLGGGLAMYVAGWTGLDATTFNAAKLNDTLVLNITTREGYTPIFNVDNYVFDNEIVQNFNDQYIGSVHLINVGTKGPIGDHSIPHIKEVFGLIDSNAESRLVAKSIPDRFVDLLDRSVDVGINTAISAVWVGSKLNEYVARPAGDALGGGLGKGFIFGQIINDNVAEPAGELLADGVIKTGSAVTNLGRDILNLPSSVAKIVGEGIKLAED